MYVFVLFFSCFLSLYFSVPVVFADAEASYESLVKEYSTLRSDYRNIVKKREVYESTFLERIQERRKYEADFRACSDNSWRVLHEPTRSKIEQDKQKLEEEHKKVISYRGALESERIKIEQRRRELEAHYTESGEARGARYVAGIRDYIDNLRTKYIDPVRLDLFIAYDSYLDGINAYAEFIRGSVRSCKEGEIPPGHLIAWGGKILEAAANIASILI